MHSSAYSNVCGRLKYSTKLYLANHGKGFKKYILSLASSKKYNYESNILLPVGSTV